MIAASSARTIIRRRFMWAIATIAVGVALSIPSVAAAAFLSPVTPVDPASLPATVTALHVSYTSAGCFNGVGGLLTGCHDSSRNLIQVHERYVGPGAWFSQYATTCELCHRPTVQSDRSCTGVCHGIVTHSARPARHTPTSASAACTTCHPSDLDTIHGAYTDLARCGWCHASKYNWSKTADCANCHVAETAHECSDCHKPGSRVASSTVDFTAARPVDRATACRKCHWEPTGSHPFHNISWDCVSCHPEMGATNHAAIPRVRNEAYGAFFNSAASAYAGTATLHAIHASPRWAASLTKGGRRCASCHAAANCTVCHAGAISLTHEDHSWDATLGAYYPGTEPSSMRFGSGTSPGNEGEDSVIPALSCSNATCHDIATSSSSPVLIEDTDSRVVYSASPLWARSSTSGYSGNSYRISNGIVATATLRFNGQRVDLISDRSAYRGKARISIDSLEVTTVDLYAAVSEKQATVFESEPLATGEHTITVEVTGQANDASRGAYVVIDAFRVYSRWGTTLTQCSACHAPDDFTGTAVDRTRDHYGR
jgi:hypothetical protein